MAHLLLGHIVAAHPGGRRLRKPDGERTLRAVRPSRRNELHYRRELGLIVSHLRAATAELADELRETWPAPARDGVAADAVAPGFWDALRRASGRFGDLEMTAARLTDVRNRLSVVRRNKAAVDEALIAAVRQAVGVDITGALHDAGRIQSEMQAAARENVALIKSIPAQHFARVQAVVEEAFESGTRWESMAKDLREVGDITDRRARIIARDQTAKMNSSFNEVRQTEIGVTEYTWSGAMDARERDSHKAMEGVRCKWSDPPTVDGDRVHPGQAILCFPADSKVQFAHDVKKAYRRRYSGELAEIVTDSGKTLRATPNHPVLTDRGWVPLGQLHEGDHVVEVAKEVFDATKGRNQDRVPAISEVFEAAASDDAKVLRRSTHEVDFHGDGTDGDVDIVLAARLLRVDAVTAGAQRSGQVVFSKAHNPRLSLGASLHALLGVANSARRLVGWCREILSLFWGQSLHSEQLRFAYAASGDAGLCQAPLNHDPFKAGALGDRQFALSGEVGGNDGRDVDGDPVPAGMPGSPTDDQAASSKHFRQVVLAEADDLPGFPERLPFRQQSSRVIKASRINGWSGHVYNLETATGWYVTEGIVTHNCRCIAQPVINVMSLGAAPAAVAA